MEACMFRDRSVLPRLHRWALALGSALVLGGCATAPAPAQPQWIAMTQLVPAPADPGAPWFPRAASLMLRNELATIPGLMVVVPPPATAATGSADIPQQVEWIVGGAVGRAGGRTHFDITLRRNAEAAPSWQRRFEYASDGDASRWRRDIPAAIAEQVGVRTKSAEAGDLGACQSALAAEDTLRAIEAYGNYRTRDDILRVRGWLEQALQQEPGCAEAQAQRAMTHVTEVANRWSTEAKALEFADQLSRQVVAAHPRQPFAHLARLQVLRLQGQIAAAVQQATTLTQLDPSNGLFVGRLAALKFDAGDAAGTLAAARRMQALPNGTFAALQQGLLFEAMARYSLGEEEQSAAVLRKLLALNPQSSFAWQLLASIEALHGRDAEAAAALQRFLALAPAAGQSIRRLRANETTVPDGLFKAQRERYYAGLRRAGMPE
jgi:tetratricopeptide (TPR) repeat protein